MSLRDELDAAVGKADVASLRAALLADAGLFAKRLGKMAGRLPFALVLVVDQAEELFTLAHSPEEIALRDHALRLIQRVWTCGRT